MEEQHTLSPSQVLNVHRGGWVVGHRGRQNPVMRRQQAQCYSSKLCPSHKALQNTAVIPNRETIMFLDCYMNAKSPDNPMSPLWEILRSNTESITERKGGTLDATRNFYSSLT